MTCDVLYSWRGVSSVKLLFRQASPRSERGGEGWDMGADMGGERVRGRRVRVRVRVTLTHPNPNPNLRRLGTSLAKTLQSMKSV